MSRRPRTSGAPAVSLLEDNEGVALRDRLALRDDDLLHHAWVLGLDRHLHLHRLEDHDRVALVDGVADRDLDLPHRPGDVRLNVGHPCSSHRLPRTRATILPPPPPTLSRPQPSLAPPTPSPPP